MNHRIRAFEETLKTKAAEGLAVLNDPRLAPKTKTARLAVIEEEMVACQAEIDAQKRVQARVASMGGALADAGGSHPSVDGWYFGADAGRPPMLTGLAAGLAGKGHQPVAPPALTITVEEGQELYEAATRRKSVRVELSTKVLDTPGIAPSTIPQYVLPPVMFRREPSRLLNYLPRAATPSGSVEWFSASGTSAAAPVAEGGLKPVSAMTVTANITKATKIAHMVIVNEEVLADFAAFLGFLSQDMSNGIINAENLELLSGTGVAPSMFAGLLNTSGILVRAKAAETYNHEVIDEAVGDLRVGGSFAEADAVVLHPTTWHLIRRSKDSQGRPIVQPDPTVGSAATLLGLPVVETTQIPVGTALVGAFGESVMVYLRQGILIETSNAGSDYFQRNQVAMIAEERLILSVPRPAGLCKVTGLV